MTYFHKKKSIENQLLSRIYDKEKLIVNSNPRLSYVQAMSVLRMVHNV